MAAEGVVACVRALKHEHHADHRAVQVWQAPCWPPWPKITCAPDQPQHENIDHHGHGSWTALYNFDEKIIRKFLPSYHAKARDIHPSLNHSETHKGFLKVPTSLLAFFNLPWQQNMRTNPELEFVGTEISDRVKINNLNKWLHHFWGMTDTLFDFDWYSNHSLMHVTFISPIFHSPPSAQYHPAPPFLTLAPASGEAERVRKSCLTY